MILPETIDAVRRAANIVEIVSESVALQRRGGNYTGLCPFHSEKTPSFSVREEAGYYHCFGCGASGNVISFVMETMGMSFPESVEYLASRYGVEVKRGEGYKQAQKPRETKYLIEINKHALQFFKASLKKSPDEVKRYCIARNLNAEVREEFGLGFSPTSWDALGAHLSELKFSEEQQLASGLIRRSARGTLYDLFRGRLIFPIFNERREPIAFGGRTVPGLLQPEQEKKAPKYVNSPETDIYQKSTVLYGLPHALKDIREKKEVLLVEGYMDVIGLWKSGVKNVLATCGTAVTERHVSRLSKLAQRVLLLFDGDRAGRNAAASSFKLFLNSGVDVSALFFSEGEDPDSIATANESGTATFLEGLTRTSLLEAYISSILDSFGVDSIKSVGAASKGKICKQVVQQLSAVKNVFEKNELIRQAAFLLMVDESELLRVLERKPESGGIGEQSEKVLSEQPAIDGGVPIGSVQSLDSTNRALLQCVIVHRDTLVERVLTDPQLCVSLSAPARVFIEGLADLMVGDEEGESSSQKKRVMEFLRYLGSDWIALWKESYQLSEQPETNLQQVFEDCRKKLRSSRLKDSLRELERQIRDASTDEEKLLLSDQKIKFERKLRQLL